MFGTHVMRRTTARFATGVVSLALLTSVLTIGVATPAFAAGTTISQATNPVASESQGVTTVTVNPQNIGDLVIFQSQIHSPTITVGSVSSAKTGTWHLAERFVGPTTPVITEEIWWAVATSTGPTTIDATYSSDISGINPGPELVSDSFTSSNPVTWGAVPGNGAGAPTTTAIDFPSVNSNSVVNQLYWGYAENLSTGVPGTTSGFTWTVTAQGNLVTSNVSLSTSTSYAPTATSTSAANNTSIAAIFSATPTVVFNGNSNGHGVVGGSMSSEIANVPTALTANAFTLTGYSFAGWNTAANGSGSAYADGASYPFETGGTNLYTQWTPNVTFNGNNSTFGSMAPETASAPTALTPNAFTRTGYTFAGWNTAANGSGTHYGDGASFPFSAPTTLYAQWTPNVTFVGNGSTGGSMNPETASVPTPLTLNSFSRSGYTFAGWNTAANGSGTSYAQSATYPFSAPTTLYAQWTANNVTVTFVGNLSTSGSMSPEINNLPGALTTNAFTRTGYTFSGWNTAANGSGTRYAKSATYPLTAATPHNAQWTANNVTVTFVGNGANHGAMSPEIHNAPSALSSNAFTRTGYSFRGWNTAAHGSGTSYANGASYPFTAATTLYAQWTANNVRVVFVGNGSNHGSMKSENHNAPSALTSNAFARTGYTFRGWNSRANGSGKKYANRAIFAFKARTTLYAQWTAVPHASRVVGSVMVGESRHVTIVGRGFTNLSRVKSNEKGTVVRVLHASATQLTILVSVAKGSALGVHTFTITTPSRTTCQIRYNTK